ncbi:Pre-mRNA-splicing factor sap61, partial [Coemansia nantahalensis]
MDSIVEQQRQAHEDIERLEQAVVDLMMQDLAKHRHRLLREHKINELLEEIQGRSRLLEALEADESGLRGREVAALASRPLDEFYARLGAIGDHHRLNPGLAVQPPELDYVKYKNNPEDPAAAAGGRGRQAADAAEPDTLGDGGDSDGPAVEAFIGAEDVERLEVLFSGEERLGRYVDLTAQHEQYLNTPGAPRVSYLEYLATFDEFAGHPRAAKDAQYAAYVRSLLECLEGFFARAMPLFDLPAMRRQAQDEFAEAWRNGRVPGWEPAAAAAGEGDGHLYCAPCKRQFEKDTTYQAHLASR